MSGAPPSRPRIPMLPSRCVPVFWCGRALPDVCHQEQKACCRVHHLYECMKGWRPSMIHGALRHFLGVWLLFQYYITILKFYFHRYFILCHVQLYSNAFHQRIYMRSYRFHLYLLRQRHLNRSHHHLNGD